MKVDYCLCGLIPALFNLFPVLFSYFPILCCNLQTKFGYSHYAPPPPFNNSKYTKRQYRESSPKFANTGKVRVPEKD